MKISIIIPVYNVAVYLEQCVQSVLLQTYTDTEILLVDDGSTDQSGQICDRLALQDERIRVVHKTNGGLSDARNAGLRRAMGKYVAFLDGDDVWLQRDGLQQMVALLEQNPTDLLLFLCVDLYPEQKELRREYDTTFVNSHSAQEVFANLVRTQAFNMSACFQLVRRAFIEDNDLYFTKGLLSEDVDWSLRVWRSVERVQATNIVMYGYQHREGSITTSYTIRNLRSYDYIFRKFYALYGEEQEEKNTPYWQTALGYLAQMYTSCLYGYNQIAQADKPEAMQILLVNAHLLEHSVSKKSDRVVLCKKVLGLRLTIRLFALYGMLKRRRKN